MKGFYFRFLDKRNIFNPSQKHKNLYLLDKSVLEKRKLSLICFEIGNGFTVGYGYGLDCNGFLYSYLMLEK
jgi:hypoxanthine-guanine phosphoribosyltransferase